MSKMSEIDAASQSENPAQHWHVIPHDRNHGEWIHRTRPSAIRTMEVLFDKHVERIEIERCTAEECLALDRAIEASNAR